jgi:hypothetical protein
MDIDELSENKHLDDIRLWTTNPAAAWRLRWLRIVHQEGLCSYCPPNRGENERRDVYPRWKRQREKAKRQRKGRC